MAKKAAAQDGQSEFSVATTVITEGEGAEPLKGIKVDYGWT